MSARKYDGLGGFAPGSHDIPAAEAIPFALAAVSFFAVIVFLGAAAGF